ncbi:MAG TPA: NAD(P)/FAD-dependent oxidoreductase [Bacteroidales bacterium]|nr:NAD(P)/FAD-dependent oxidoreductase [Bacteroidales bacterium]HOX78756.1 NAD(P)/FAD-dependent oxidoreductase [Bacteroidales bacterium]HPI85778.1 NAD(P)/FAD-dependent oxidoreductase [Bacteroidales bacterium]HPM91871.1 NAD(P)/FAD-dependent oxidoreductase [Bacteroidales bacterium]
MNYDFVITGSGLGGLVSGIILAKEGHSVCILEKNHKPGGNLQTFERFGHSFNTGLHYIGSMEEGQTLHRFFNYLGIAGKLPLVKMDEDGYDRIVFGEEETVYRHAQGWERFEEEMERQFPSERDSISTYVKSIRDIIRSIPLYDLENASTPRLEMSQLNRCTMDFLRGITRNRRLISVLAGANSIYHGAAGRTPLYLHACIRNSFVSSAWRIKGGSDKLTDLLAETFTSLGGKILTGAEVTGFIPQNDRIASVELRDGRRIEGKQFISNLHPGATLKLTGLETLRKSYRHRIENLENTAGFFSLYLVFRENTFPYLNHNLFQYYHDDYFKDDLPEEKWPHTYMIYTPYHDDNKGFTKTASILTFMKNEQYRQWENLAAAGRGEDYRGFREMASQKLLDAVEKRYPGIRSSVARFCDATPLTFADYTGTPGGSGYGILKDCHDPVRSIITPKTKIPNLFFTGQNLNIHGVLGTTISAIVTCSEFTGFRNLVNKIVHA